MNLYDFTSTLTRSWLVIAVTTVASLTGGWVASSTTHTVYSTASRVVIPATSSVGTPKGVQHITSMTRPKILLY